MSCHSYAEGTRRKTKGVFSRTHPGRQGTLHQQRLPHFVAHDTWNCSSQNHPIMSQSCVASSNHTTPGHRHGRLVLEWLHAYRTIFCDATGVGEASLLVWLHDDGSWHVGRQTDTAGSCLCHVRCVLCDVVVSSEDVGLCSGRTVSSTILPVDLCDTRGVFP